MLVAVIPLLLTGCAAVERQECSTASCSRALSTPDTLVIWWAPGMRGGLPEDQDTTSYTLGD
ncbi:HrpT family type III secretion system protein [Billgrantia sp. Q4P2]|uniref:HrpT family type III secretion system protein n=1 Tax=Billgrantia sp. Q4P2 TaxID=3463857 RepID=UPI00405604D8